MTEQKTNTPAIDQPSQELAATKSICLVVFSGELDKLLAAFTIATGAAASGMRASMFFTFWGTAALKKAGKQSKGKTLVERMFGWLLPGGLHRRKLTHLDMAGMGRRMLGREMLKKNLADLPALIDIAKHTAVEINICEMSMSLMGIKLEELLDYPNMSVCGVAFFLNRAANANVTLFI